MIMPSTPGTLAPRGFTIRNGKAVNTVDGHRLLDYVVIVILLLLTLFALGIIGYNEIIGRPPDATMLSVLTFILGFLASQLGVQRGANVAATSTAAANTATAEALTAQASQANGHSNGS